MSEIKQTKKRFLPLNISTTTDFADSVFNNEECELVLVNLVRMQKSTNELYWTSFTWEDYKNFCTHTVTDRERSVLTAFVKGGKPVWSASAVLDAGWLHLVDGKYSFSDKMIEMLGDAFVIADLIDLEEFGLAKAAALHGITWHFL